MNACVPRLWPWILIPVVGLVVVVAFAIVGFLTYGAAGPYPWLGWGFFPWFPFVGIWIFFGFLFFFGVVRWGAAPWGGYSGWDRRNADDSSTILRERYARGEITREQFGEMRRELDEHLIQNAYDEDRARSRGP